MLVGDDVLLAPLYVVTTKRLLKVKNQKSYLAKSVTRIILLHENLL